MTEILYVPILKTKRAELTAISQLHQSVKSKLLPLFEIEPVPLDPETDIPDRTYNEHLFDFGKKIASSCTEILTVLIDGVLIEDKFISAGDTHPITNAVKQARESGMHVIPVSSPTRDENYLNEIDSLVLNEVCLRLTVTDLANPQLIQAYISRLNITPQSIDILIDLRSALSEEVLESGQSKTLTMGLINNLNKLHDFRRVVLAAGSFPIDLSQISIGIYSQPRFEWMLWRSLRNDPQLARKVIYSDYGIQHPEYTRLATRFPSVSASVRYTGDNDYWVFRGRKANRYGYEQYGAHSQKIIAHAEYSGETFSSGDSEIYCYAQKYYQYLEDQTSEFKFGSAEVWRKIGQNHHITKVIYQLSNLCAF